MFWELENRSPVDPPAPPGSTTPTFGKALLRPIQEEESSGVIRPLGEVNDR
jgi:hypothetical protein